MDAAGLQVVREQRGGLARSYEGEAAGPGKWHLGTSRGKGVAGVEDRWQPVLAAERRGPGECDRPGRGFFRQSCTALRAISEGIGPEGAMPAVIAPGPDSARSAASAVSAKVSVPSTTCVNAPFC